MGRHAVADLLENGLLVVLVEIKQHISKEHEIELLLRLQWSEQVVLGQLHVFFQSIDYLQRAARGGLEILFYPVRMRGLDALHRASRVLAGAGLRQYLPRNV